MLQRAVAHDPGDPVVLNNLGWAWQMLGQPDEALTCYRRALVLDERLRIARRNAIALLLALGDGTSVSTCGKRSYRSDADGLEWIRRLVSDTLDGGRLPRQATLRQWWRRYAGAAAQLWAVHRLSTLWNPSRPTHHPVNSAFCGCTTTLRSSNTLRTVESSTRESTPRLPPTELSRTSSNSAKVWTVVARSTTTYTNRSVPPMTVCCTFGRHHECRSRFRRSGIGFKCSQTLLIVRRVWW